MHLLMNTRDFEGASRDEALNYRFSKVKLPLDTKRALLVGLSDILEMNNLKLFPGIVIV